MVDRTGRSIDTLPLRDLCDLCEYRLLENASDKDRKRIREQLANAGRAWERRWAARHPLPAQAIAAARGVRLRSLAPAGPEGIVVNLSGTVT